VVITVQKPPIQTFTAFQRGRIYARDLDATTFFESPIPGISVVFGELTAADASALAAAMDQSSAAILDRFQQNRRCFAAWHGDEIASYCWISMQQEYVGEMESVLDIYAGEGYIWNCATLPQHRRQGLYTTLLAFMLQTLSSQGMNRIWIGADLENIPSLRAFDTVGFLPAAAFTFFRLWRLYGFITRPLAQTPPHLLKAGRRLFQIDRLVSLGPLALGWRSR
jgi:ribosomal protein S18 acetylase RimI-like enzyme